MFDLNSTPRKGILQVQAVLKEVMSQQKIPLRKKISPVFPFKDFYVHFFRLPLPEKQWLGN